MPMSIFAFRKLLGHTYDFSAESRLPTISVLFPAQAPKLGASGKYKETFKNCVKKHLQNAPLGGNGANFNAL